MGQILVIDDDKAIRRIIFLLLEQLGYNVTVAEDGKKGIELFNSISGIDLVITDIRMPGMDGNEVGKYIRNSVKPDTPVIAITAYPDDIGEGVFDFSLIKPFKLLDLQHVVESFKH